MYLFFMNKKKSFTDSMVNFLMREGKKCKSKKIIKSVFSKILRKINVKENQIEEKIFSGVLPSFDIKKKKIGGAMYQIPIEIKYSKALAMTVKWVIKYAKVRNDAKNIDNGLFLELLDMYLKRGRTFKKMEEIKNTVIKNKAFLCYQ